MARQLALLDTLPDWQLDERTREIGRQGLAQARAALAAARPAETAAAETAAAGERATTRRRAAGRPGRHRSAA